MMKLKKIVAFNPGVRHQITIQKNLLSKYNNIIKNLIFKKVGSGGRNNSGRITVRHKGGNINKKFHFFSNPKLGFFLSLCTMYNSNSNGFISLNFDIKKKVFFKSITSKNVYSGCLLDYNSILPDFKLGYQANLKSLPVGSLIHNVSINNKTIYSKSAGSFSQIIQKKKEAIKIKLSSGRLINVLPISRATLGITDNSIHKLTKIGQAGRNRLLGIRPSVRGVAMNPVDHPHGGKSNKGMHPVTPWGLPTRNVKTVKSH